MQKLTPDFDASELEIQSYLPQRKAACPPLAVLRALKEDCLPEEVAEPARGHLSRCALCQMLLADLEALPGPEFSLAQQQRIASRLPPAAASASFWSLQKSLIGFAAVLLLMAGLFAWKHREQTEEVASTNPPSAAASPSLREIPFTPLTSPAGSAALLSRGGSPRDEPANEELLPAFRAYNHADYAVAAQQFELLSTRYPESGLILLYLGVSQLALSQNEEAQATLHQARAAHQPYAPDAAEWYSAVAASRRQLPEAVPLLRELCHNKTSKFSDRSCQALPPADAGK